MFSPFPLITLLRRSMAPSITCPPPAEIIFSGWLKPGWGNESSARRAGSWLRVDTPRFAFLSWVVQQSQGMFCIVLFTTKDTRQLHSAIRLVVLLNIAFTTHRVLLPAFRASASP